MEPLTFTVEMESSAGGGVKIPFDVREIFGRAKQLGQVTINCFTYRSAVAVYGGAYYASKTPNREWPTCLMISRRRWTRRVRVASGTRSPIRTSAV